MNQIYRALHMPPKRLIKKLSGQKEIYTIAVRRAPKGEGCDPLPALGEEPYTPLPYTPGTWYADPLLYEDDNGKRWLSAKHSIWRRTAVILPWRSLMKTTTCCRPAWY